MYKKFILALSISAMTTAAQAGCYGSDNFKTCYDNNGNNYTVNKIGDTTITNGSNPSNGSYWTQRSTTIGDTTYQTGTAANGSPWNSTIRDDGYGTSIYGTDSSGKPFNSYQINNK